MVSNCVLQAIRLADDLKRKISSSQDLLNDTEARIAQQQLQKIYQQLLILDLEYSLNQKIEHDLWNFGFKNYIDILQKLVKDKKNSKRIEYQGLWTSCLDAASGFYLILLQEICTTFTINLPLPGYRKEGIFQVNKIKNQVESVIKQPEINSCYYICQHCLVHLGDIARYRFRCKQSESFYRSAILLSPMIGQPYNQLALLEASRGNKLATVFYYIRSVSCRNPFPAASSNLAITLQKSEINQIDVENKLLSSSFISLFLNVHSTLYFGKDVKDCESYITLLTSSMTTHIVTESFTASQLIQIMVINIYRYSELLLLETDVNDQDKQHIKSVLIKLIAGLLNSFLLPVYTYKEGDNMIQYFALPAIKITLDWIKLNANVLQESGFIDNLQIWPGFCKLLNTLQPMLASFPVEKYQNAVLPEEQDLQGFLPLISVVPEFRYGDNILDIDTTNKLRAWQLTKFGAWLSNSQYSLIKMNVENDGKKSFEAARNIAQPSNEFLLELEELSLSKESANDSSNNIGVEDADDLNIICSFPQKKIDISGVQKNDNDTTTESSNANEKRAGILKSNHNKGKKQNSGTNGKMSSRNVALQTILKRNQQEQLREQQEPKQVTFKTPSPSLSTGSDSQDSLLTSPITQSMINGANNINSINNTNSNNGNNNSNNNKNSNSNNSAAKTPLLSFNPYSGQNNHTLHNQPTGSLFNPATNTFTNSSNFTPANNYGLNSNVYQVPQQRSSNFSGVDISKLPFSPAVTNPALNNASFPVNNSSDKNGNVNSLIGNSNMFYSSHQSQYSNTNHGIQNLIPSWNKDVNNSQKLWRDDDRLKFSASNVGNNALINSPPPRLADHHNNGFIQRPPSTWQYNSQQKIQQDPLSMNNTSLWPNFKAPVQSPNVMQNLSNSRLLFNQQMHSNPMGPHSMEEDQRNMYMSRQPPPPNLPPTQVSNNSYSLFNHTMWNPSNVPDHQQQHQQMHSSTVGNSNSLNITPQPAQGFNVLSQQSLWSEGPSPLQRLLEQQKQLRDGQSFQMGGNSN